jgi:metal-responsive CopG/Arc/MetJ family transcriptional regulator
MLYNPVMKRLDENALAVLVALRLPPALLARVDAEAKRLGVNRSAAVRILLVESLSRRERKKPQ